MNANLPERVLLATDASEDASAATRAADLANRGGSELHVVHAFEFIPSEYMSLAFRLRSPSGFRRQGQKVLDEQVRLIERPGRWRPTSEKACRSTRS